ncbi:MAG: helix-turn-helix domain-containing protein [Christensenellaceae bacterium]|jgi:transcriptional regulator with XRE-family HTH domain|nr:helix-turn-helix domain-containing protein [Christensenellaceae bacterium]
MNNEFGQFIETKRKEKGINLRGFAEMVGIAPAYMSDLEKGYRYPPELEKLNIIAKKLLLSEQDTQKMYDLAAKVKTKGNIVPVSPDLPNYIMNTEACRVALRTARDMNADNDVWQEVIKILEERKKNGG